MIRRRLLLVLLLVLPQLVSAADRHLAILLTNDDGFDAPGLSALHAALRQAGHRVTVVAPLSQQSGSGVRITLGEIAVVDHGDGMWSVDGSPADAASYGLTQIMAAAPPDLVISGANLGQNLGSNVVSSGTVGAAVMAVQLGVPALAVSVGLDMGEATAEPQRFPSTLAAFPRAAVLTVRLVAALAERAGSGRLLPADTVLNLNYPARPLDAIKGVRLAPLSRHGGFRVIYPVRPEQAKILSTIAADPAGRDDTGTDTALFAANYITLSVLRPDWNASPRAASRMGALLGDLEPLRTTP